MRKILLLAALLLSVGCGAGRSGVEAWKNPPTKLMKKQDPVITMYRERCAQERVLEEDLDLCVAAKVNPWAKISYRTVVK